MKKLMGAVLGAMLLASAVLPAAAQATYPMPTCVINVALRTITVNGVQVQILRGTEGYVTALPSTGGTYTVKWSVAFEYAGTMRDPLYNFVEPFAAGTQIELTRCGS